MDTDSGRLFQRIPSKLVNVGRLPSKAGGMRIEFHVPTNGKVPTPSLNTETMTAILPMDESVAFHTLEAGSTFLFTWRLFDRTEAWYGGCTNGLPFLVRMSGSAMQVYNTNGEDAFLKALLPAWASQMQQSSLGGPAVRIGPVFAYPLPFSWDQIDLLAQLIGGRNLVNDERAAFRVANTFYRIKGCCRQYNGTPLKGKEVRIVQGMLEGPIQKIRTKDLLIDTPSKKFQHRLPGVCAIMLIEGIAT